MTKISRKKKRAKDHRLHKLSVQQQGNWADRTPNRRKNDSARPHKFYQIHKTLPPKFVEKVLYFLLPLEVSEGVVGDLAEHYQKLQPKLGTKGARIWYYKEAGILLLRRFPSVIKVVFYAWVREFFSHHIR